MRTRFLAAVFASIVTACGGNETQSRLTITISGPQTIPGSTLITASPAELANEVSWSLSGPGSLSGTTGQAVVYRPPVPANPAPATVTASARGQTAMVTFTSHTPQQAPHTIAGLTAAVDVTYDQFDIPHIFCANQNDCYAAQGYIQAQDRLFQMDLFRRTAEGRAAELVGSVLINQDKQFLALFATRDGLRIEDKLVAALDDATRAKLDAFTKGVNAYLAFLKQNSTLMPQEYAQISAGITPADIPDWTPADTLALGRLQQFQLSETISEETAYGLFALTFARGPLAEPGRVNAYIRPVQPLQAFTLAPSDSTSIPSAPGGGTQPAVAAASAWAPGLAEIHGQMEALHDAFGPLSADPGSNNWVVDAAHSATGQAMVANDPHLALQYPPLFHLAAMTASDGSGLNLVGGSFPGVPGALIGRGKHVGWGVTVVGYDVTDLYMEVVDPTCTPTPCVKINGVFKPTIVALRNGAPYSIKVRGGDPVSFPVLVVPEHGPIIQYNPATDPTHAISVRWTGHEVTQDLKAFLDLNNADAVGDLSATGTTAFAALKNYAIGAQNFVLADDQGNIGYDPHALVPVRDWATTHFPWLPLRGDDGSSEWGSTTGDTSCATNPTSTCWVADDKLPRGVNPSKGYFATANSDPAGFTGHPPTSPFGSSIFGPALYPYLSFDWSDPTAVRYARIAQLLATKTANGGKVSLGDMQAIQSDHAIMLGKLFEPLYPPVSAVPAANQAAYTTARGLLTAWGTDNYDCPTGLTGTDPNSPAVTDATQLRDSAACLLFHTFVQKLLHNVFDDDFAVVTAARGQSFSGDAGAEVRAMLYMLQPNTPAADTHFCDDVDPTFNSTKTKQHTCQEQVITALVAAVTTLQSANGTDQTKWLWGRVHTMTAQSPAAPLIGSPFKAGPFARPGGALSVDVGNPNFSQSSSLSFAYGSGSNVRFIAVMDPAAANAQVKMQLPGPERDAPFGVFSSTPNLISSYVQNQYFDFLYGHQIDGRGLSAQRFTAQ